MRECLMKSISKAEGIHYGALSLICQQHFQPRTQFTWNQVIHTLCGVCCCCCWCCRMRWTDIIQAEDRNGNKTTKQTGRQQKKADLKEIAYIYPTIWISFTAKNTRRKRRRLEKKEEEGDGDDCLSYNYGSCWNNVLPLEIDTRRLFDLRRTER